MSIRSSLTALHQPFRHTLRSFSTTSRTRLSTTESSSSSNSGFASLLDSIFKDEPAAPTAPAVAESAQSSTSTTPTVRRGYHHRDIPPLIDPVVDLFTNLIMRHGQKAEAQKKMANVMRMLQETTNLPPIPLIHQAVQLGSPSVRIFNLRKSMKTIPSPRVLSDRQRTRQSINWILRAADKGRGGPIPRDQRITKEILNVLEGDSPVYKWLDERHKSGMLARSNIKAR